MNLEQIKVTQDGFRLSTEAVLKMVEYVRNGGKYTEAAMRSYNPKSVNLIAITQFEDGDLYLRDGLHRVASIYLAGRPMLYEDEYVIEHMTYSMYNEINLAVGYVTPFDPRTEVRLANFGDFKAEVLEIIAEGVSPAEFILKNRHRYCVPRQPSHNLFDMGRRILECQRNAEKVCIYK